MKKKRITAILTAFAVIVGSISFPTNLYAASENTKQENTDKNTESSDFMQLDKMEQESEELNNTESDKSEEESKELDNTESDKSEEDKELDNTEPDKPEPENIVKVIKDETYTAGMMGAVLAKDNERVALYNSLGKLIIFNGQEKIEKIIYDKEENELEINFSNTISSYIHVSNKDNKKQLSDMDGNLFRNGDKFYQNIEILDNKYVIYSEDGENFFVSSFDSDEDIAEFKRSEYGGGSTSEYGFTNTLKKVETGSAVYYIVAVTKEDYVSNTYTIFDDNFQLVIDNIKEYSIFESEYFDEVFLACTPKTDIGQVIKTLLFNNQYECVCTNAPIDIYAGNWNEYSYFENDKNYIRIETGTINNKNYDIVDRNHKKIFNGNVDLEFYDRDGIIWNEDGSGISVAARKVIPVTLDDGSVNYYIYHDGNFSQIAQGMELIDAEAEYSLYEAEDRQELYYLNEKVWSGSQKYQGIWAQDTAAALIHKESQYLYDIYVPENQKIELSDIGRGFIIKNHRFLGKSNDKILFYDLQKEEVIYSIEEELLAQADGEYNGGSISIREGEVHDAAYEGTDSEGINRFPYLMCKESSIIGSYYAYPGIYIAEDLLNYKTYPILEKTELTSYYPCINSAGYICAFHYAENGLNIMKDQTIYNLGNSRALTYTNKYFMYYDKTEEKVFFLNLETGDKIVLSDLLNEKYPELIYDNQKISYNLNDISIVQNIMRRDFYNQKQCADIIDGENIYLNINGMTDAQKDMKITLVLDGNHLEISNIYPGHIIYNSENCFFTYDENKLYKVDKQLKKVTGELELTAENIECENLFVSKELAVYPCKEIFAFINIDTFAKTEVPVLENAGISQDILYGYNIENKNLEIYLLSAGKLIKSIPAGDYIENNYKIENRSRTYFTKDSDIGTIYYINIQVYDENMQYYPLAEFYCDKNGNETEIQEIEGAENYINETQSYSVYYVKSEDKVTITDGVGNIYEVVQDTPRYLGATFKYFAILEDGTKCFFDNKYNIVVKNQEFIDNYLIAITPWTFGVNGKKYWLLNDGEKQYSLYDENYNLITNELTWANDYGGEKQYLEGNYKEGVYHTDKGIYYLSLEGPVFYETAVTLCKLNDKYIAVAYEDHTDIIDRETLRTIYKMNKCYKFHYYGELIENYYIAKTFEESEEKYVSYLVYFGADKQILDKDGLLVITDKDGQVSEDIVLSVENITDTFMDKDILDKIEESYILNRIYDISLYLEGNELQIKKAVTVMIPVPETGKQGYSILRIEDNGSLTDMKAKQEDNYLIFVAEHFSKYVVVQNAYTLGDVNGDGKINIKDSALVRRYVAKWKVDITLEAADVNKDGKINIKDSALIRRYVAKWIEKF